MRVKTANTVQEEKLVKSVINFIVGAELICAVFMVTVFCSDLPFVDFDLIAVSSLVRISPFCDTTVLNSCK